MYTIVRALMRPDVAPKLPPHTKETVLGRAEAASALGIAVLIVLVLGGIWGGLFTPNEAAGVGAACAMLIGALKGMRARQLFAAVVGAGATAAPIMFLLLTAAMYAKFLAAAGIADLLQRAFAGLDLGSAGIILAMVLVWLLLGMIIDSISIILLTVPIFAPVAEVMGFDPIAFGIFGILAVEAGLLTPPFGLLVYTVKGSIEDASATLAEIFKGSVPYWLLMLVVMMLIWAFPGIATWLPSVAH
ncbi:MAG: TRAP transporter large permease subunit [Burkholderiales bacterium]|nr:TRAP transporter large permease subunit [Burkholderiales bacterium]